jgi:hypothetical protein
MNGPLDALEMARARRGAPGTDRFLSLPSPPTARYAAPPSMRFPPSIVLFALAACLAMPQARADDAPLSPAAKHDPSDPDAPAPDPAKVAAARLADLIRRGAQLCVAGEVDDGITALKAAWVQRQDADLALQLAACEVKGQQWPGAAEHLAFALRTKDDPEQRKALEATFSNVRARVGAVKVTVTVDGAYVFAGDRFAGQSPLPGEVYVSPGQARISAKRSGYGEIEQAVSVQAGGTAEVTLDLMNEAASATNHRTPERRSLTPAFVMGSIGIVAAGIGVALYAAGAAKGAAADSLLGELQTAYPNPCAGNPAPGCTTLASLRSGHDTFVNVGGGMLGAGGALLGVALIYGLVTVYSGASPSRSGLTITPTAWASGAGLGAAGTF